MIGKRHLENKPRRNERAANPLGRVIVDIFSSSVVSLEGYNFAVVITDDRTGYLWLYGMKSKDDILDVVKKWYSDVAELRQLHELGVVMRDNAGENKSREIKDFFESKGVQNYFATLYEQWQNGLPESSVNFLMTLARTTMVESGLGGRFWFSAAMTSKDSHNVTYGPREVMHLQLGYVTRDVWSVSIGLSLHSPHEHLEFRFTRVRIHTGYEPRNWLPR